MRSWTICLFINLFVCHSTNGQTAQQIARVCKPGATNFPGQLSPAHLRLTDTTNSTGHNVAPFVFMASNYYTSSIGFFCRKEIQMEKALKVPVKFRLGSVAYTDKMEGKGTGVVLRPGKR